jgi:hypothetical protein
MAPLCERKRFQQEATFIATSADMQILQQNFSSSTLQFTHQTATTYNTEQARRNNHLWQDLKPL